MHTLSVQTTLRCEMVNITDQVRSVVAAAGIETGVCVVFCPHTTAGITINENSDPDVPKDLLMGLERIIPREGGWRHMEGNSDAHLKSSLFGASQQILIENGDLVLGVWQGLFFCEFDGPRSRKAHVQVISR